MNKIIGCFAVALLAVSAALPVAAQDYHKYEGFVGYTYGNYDNALDSIDNGIDSNISLRGFNGAFTYNVHRYVGIKGDYSLTANRRNYVDPTVNLEAKYKNNQFFGGVQFKDNAKDGSRWRPFAHVMAGLSNQRFNVKGSVISAPPTVTLLDVSSSTNNFAMIMGAGLDIKVSKNIDIRAVQLDYNPVFFGDQNVGTYRLSSTTQNNIRMSFGIVFH